MTKKLLGAVRMCALRNLPKLALAVLLMGLISSLFMTFLALPFAASLLSEFSLIAFISLLVSVFLSLILAYLLQYGYFVLTYLLCTDRYAVIGHLFTGFKDFKRGVQTALFFALVYVAAMFLVAAVFFTFRLFPELVQLNVPVIAMIVFAGLLLACLYLRYGFVWFFLHENSSLTVGQALRKSASFLKKKRLAFLLFCVQSGGIYLAGALVLLVFSAAIGGPAASVVLSGGVALTHMLSTLCMYVFLIRVSIAFALVYEDRRFNGDTNAGLKSGNTLSDTRCIEDRFLSDSDNAAEDP